MRKREKQQFGENKNNKEHDYDKWIKMSKKIREEVVTCKAQTKDFANLLAQVLPVLLELFLK